MINFNQGGNNFVKELFPVVTNKYFLDIVHMCCGGRKTCENSACPTTAILNARVSAVRKIDSDYWVATVLISGNVTYLPYAPNCCDVCPRTEGVYVSIEIPFANTTCNPCVDVTIDSNALTKVLCGDCSLAGNAIEIESMVTLTIETDSDVDTVGITAASVSAKK